MATKPSDQLADLNRAQLQAVRHRRGPALVIAGAGTGKTTVITRRVAWLISQGLARPEEILAVTFTDKAAREMEDRVDQLLPYGVVNTNIMTFHALGEQILREYGLEIGLRPDFTVMPNLAQIVFLQEQLQSQELRYWRPPHNPYGFVEELVRHFSRLKDEDISPARYLRYAKAQLKRAKGRDQRLEAEKYLEVAQIFERYVARARALGQIDFGDQIQLVLELFAKRPNIRRILQRRFTYILVDEYQDTNVAQTKLVEQLAGQHHNLFVVGDDDQAIYRFRGASVSNILQFKQRYPRAKQIVLRRNYRSTQQVLDTSYRLIQHNNPDRLEITNRINKRLLSGSRGPAPIFHQAETLPAEMDYMARTVRQLIDEQGIEPSEIAILLRKNNQSGLVSGALQRHGIAFVQTQNTSLLDQPEVKLLVQTIRWLNNQSDSQALYGLLSSELWHSNAHELAAAAAAARSRRVSLANYILEDLPADHELREHTTTMLGYRELIAEYGAGELLYKILSDLGYLNGLVKAAEQEPLAALQIQNIAQFFSFIRQFEQVSRQPNLYNLWLYLEDISASAADLMAEQSPLDVNAVKITTIHKAKGLEFEAVFLIDLVQHTFPSIKRNEIIPVPDSLLPYKPPANWHIEEERRLFYVGLTRAKRHLYVTASLDHGGVRRKKLSQFVLESFEPLPPYQLAEKLSGLEHLTQFDRQQRLPFDPLSLLMADGWLHLSVNQLSDYLRSPREFWYFHVLNLPKSPIHSLVFGSSIHAVIEAYYRSRMSGQPLTLAQCNDVFARSWRSEGFVSLSHEQERKRQGLAIIKRFYKQQNAADQLPIAVEKSFTLNLNRLKTRINGRYDCILPADDGVEIRDFKTGNVDTAAKARTKLKKSFQLDLYAYAWQQAGGLPVKRTSLHFVEHDILVSKDPPERAQTYRQLQSVIAGIRAHKFSDRGQSTINFERLL